MNNSVSLIPNKNRSPAPNGTAPSIMQFAIHDHERASLAYKMMQNVSVLASFSENAAQISPKAEEGCNKILEAYISTATRMLGGGPR